MKSFVLYDILSLIFFLIAIVMETLIWKGILYNYGHIATADHHHTNEKIVLNKIEL